MGKAQADVPSDAQSEGSYNYFSLTRKYAHSSKIGLLVKEKTMLKYLSRKCLGYRQVIASLAVPADHLISAIESGSIQGVNLTVRLKDAIMYKCGHCELNFW